MRSVRIIVLVVISATIASPTASAREREVAGCRIAIGGNTYANGTCLVDQEGDGLVIVTDRRLLIACDADSDGQPDADDDCDGYQLRVFRKGAFVYLFTKGNTATAYWNSAKGTHAHSLLGTLHKSGRCWVRKRTRICWKGA